MLKVVNYSVRVTHTEQWRVGRAAGCLIHDLTPQTKLPSNESSTPTLKPRCVDRAHSTRRTGLFALALGAWVLGAVTPGQR